MKRLIPVLFLLAACGGPEKTLEEYQAETRAMFAVKMDTVNYEIVETYRTPVVANYYILVKGDYTPASLQDFVTKFREDNSGDANLHFYDKKEVIEAATQYPLEDKDYIRVADHYLAAAPFDMKEIIMHPFKDAKYKRLKN